MSSTSIEEILAKLSIKFNRIFCDKEFVCSVSQDLQTIFKNSNACCVLVFPILSPNYLRVVRYQAKLLDLAVISLGSGGAKSIGICQKKYLLTPPDLKDNLSTKTGDNQMAENSNNTRKKRPPIQLYVPPAQRKARSFDKTGAHKDKSQLKKLDSKNCTKKQDTVIKNAEDKDIFNKHTGICFCSDDIDFIIGSQGLPYLPFQCNSYKMILFKNLFSLAKLLIFNIKIIKHSFHILNWKVQGRVLFADFIDFKKYPNISIDTCPKFQEKNNCCNCDLSDSIDYFCIEENIMLDVKQFDTLHEETAEICYHCYLTKEEDCLKIDQIIRIFLNSGKRKVTERDNFDLNSFMEMKSPHMPSDEPTVKSSTHNGENIANTENTQIQKPKQIDRVIVLDERIEPVNISSKVAPELKVKKNEHEQEKEIMRKAKQNMNRKTRPIIKYVEDDDTLKIGKNDNVNNWEDLFDENGELDKDIFSEIVQKVGPEVKIFKAEEDYSDYATKHIEELEHMVELYDFPSTLETHDLISAFSEINSESMYVKWVDDTHAILVLGSYTQARKAIAMSNPLIKVRPMSAASSLALEKANQFDLKPAMKRPQTNLQTARRLITSHLGAKSQISREQSAKEREDLRIAKELKKIAKQNEKAAWEGNLRSNIK